MMDHQVLTRQELRDRCFGGELVMTTRVLGSSFLQSTGLHVKKFCLNNSILTRVPVLKIKSTDYADFKLFMRVSSASHISLDGNLNSQWDLSYADFNGSTNRSVAHPQAIHVFKVSPTKKH